MNEDERNISKKCNLFFANKRFIHLTLKNGGWRNGQIISVNADYIEFNEREDGYQIFFFSEIRDVEIYVERKKNYG